MRANELLKYRYPPGYSNMPALLLISVLVFFRLCVAEAADGPIVATLYGKVQGRYSDTAQVFTSIPYATPPVDELRWKAPRPPKPWSDVIVTTDDPPGCPQAVPCLLPLPQYLCPKRVTEDCLYLNVFTPLTADPSSRLPVMVFVHGGNFLRGYSGGLLYDGQYIANTTTTVVVTVNYRLGAMGFLVYGTGEGALKGNYGLKDQRLALEWVQDNIAAFGGNPDQVTFWGQSAGAISGAVLMTSVQSGGLFHRAILESEPFAVSLKSTKDARKLGEDFAKELECGDNDVDCLYSKDVADIEKAQKAVMTKIVDIFHFLELFLQWSPTVDGDEVLDQPLTLFARGEVAPIPMIIGTTSQETVFFIYDGFTKPIKDLEYDGFLFAVFELHYGEVHGKYPPSSGDQRPEMTVLSTDYTFTCPTRHAVQEFVNHTRIPTWMYVFNHSLSFDGWGKNFSFCNGHSCELALLPANKVDSPTQSRKNRRLVGHAVELPFVFHTATLGGFNYTQDELTLAGTMVQYWTNFAHYGNPNGPPEKQVVLNWPMYSATKEANLMKFKTPANEVVTNYLASPCNFWDAVGYSV